MAVMSFGVTVQTVIDAAYGITVPSESHGRVQALINKAIGLLLDEIPNLEHRVTDGRTKSASAKSVVEDMVVRVLRNPNALRQITINGDSATIDQAVSSGQLYVTEAELARLRKDVSVQASKRAGKLRSIRQALPPWM